MPSIFAASGRIRSSSLAQLKIFIAHFNMWPAAGLSRRSIAATASRADALPLSSDEGRRSSGLTLSFRGSDRLIPVRTSNRTCFQAIYRPLNKVQVGPRVLGAVVALWIGAAEFGSGKASALDARGPPLSTPGDEICGTVRWLKMRWLVAVTEMKNRCGTDLICSASGACRHRPGRRGGSGPWIAFGRGLRS